MPPPKPAVALIAGPTASGKSDLAVKLAQEIEARGGKAAIINADSAQVYADLRILSARPSEEEMGGIKHVLFGAWDGAEACSAGDWAKAAKYEIARLHEAGTIPILCGGTGMYMRVLLDGIAPIPAVAPEIREVVRSLTTSEAYAALQTEDPERAAALSENDSQRIARALEVVRSTGKPLAYWQSRLEGGIAQDITLHPLVLLPDREWLYDRCNRRFEIMLLQGAVGEVQALLERQLDPTLPVMRAIGVPEISAWLGGEISREEMMSSGQQATRNYAKRQFTWFRRQSPDAWPRMEPQNCAIDTVFASLLHF